MRTLKIKNNDMEIKDKIETLFEKEVTKFGSGAKIDCPKKYLGKKALVIIREKD
jgi:putative transposon-encoded protein